ncbi:potassium channel family protein [Phytomonospora endophytica]|uniref:Trk system potassium uptake protein TrkA n=1 Tax=Phytomonospora endophytica TaxID=714109 RepID=A0A841FSY3_9ACTN|nr:TrkA family potassium uptake protein [Phytomonospora endophytica]MBB6039146.1 trk system potassium uptake protein TrkA [Phytomonospora endophytica]GIG67617.1 potassium transporter [Phytomonospora endophytica]
MSAKKKRLIQPDSGTVAVIGLGRFGGAVAESLVRLGHEVLAIDERAEIVQQWSDRLTHVVQADATDASVLSQLGIGEFDRVVVAIGTDIEASVLTVLAVEEAGVGEIWAKAITAKHGRILHRVGAHHVVYPEAAMGERVAHLVTGRMIDFIEFDDGFAIVKTRPPAEAVGRTLAEAQLRTKYGVTVVGVKRPGEDFTYARPDTSIAEGDLIIVSGPTMQVETFAAIT